MAYDADNLACIGNGGAIGSGQGSVARIWHYKTNDTLAQAVAADYFNSATSLLAKGDMIFVSGDIDGTVGINGLVVSSATGAASVTTVGFSTVTQTYNSRFALNSTITLTNGDSGYVVAPAAGTMTRIDTVLIGGAVATNDAVCTFKIGAAGAGTGITNGVVTIGFSGSAIGDKDTASPSALRTVAAGDLIYCTVSGTPGGSRSATVTMYFDAT
jgi:hypothetical protein